MARGWALLRLGLFPSVCHSSSKLALEFLCFHISGKTTELILLLAYTWNMTFSGALDFLFWPVSAAILDTVLWMCLPPANISFPGALRAALLMCLPKPRLPVRGGCLKKKNTGFIYQWGTFWKPPVCSTPLKQGSAQENFCLQRPCCCYYRVIFLHVRLFCLAVYLILGKHKYMPCLCPTSFPLSALKWGGLAWQKGPKRPGWATWVCCTKTSSLKILDISLSSLVTSVPTPQPRILGNFHHICVGCSTN